jgi:23S rRNA 5-hydroxycytidine C2501 synthase
MQELQGLVVGTPISRNRDHAWELTLTRKSSERSVPVDIRFIETATGFTLTLADRYGASATATIEHAHESAQNAERAVTSLRENLGKLGNTIFTASNITIDWSEPWFVPASVVNALRREAVERLEQDRIERLSRWTRAEASVPPAQYPETSLTYLANVYNVAARDFYAQHGVKLIADAYEAHTEAGEVPVMVTKHCLRWSFNLCPKQAKGVQGVQGQVRAEPMTLVSGSDRLTLKFDCKPCEMHVMGKMRPNILRSPAPSLMPAISGVAPLKFYVKQPAKVLAS